MSATNYSDCTIEQLLSIFEHACLEQYECWFTDDIDKSNAEYDNLVAVKDELQLRGDDARRALARLMSHDNPQVRLQAATFVYPVAREDARRCLEALAATLLPHRLDAGMTLRFLEEKPDCLDH